MEDYESILFPEIEPYNTGMLPVSDLHTLYFEEVGNPNGKPVVYLHGGPGAGISSKSRRFFDPAFYRIILLDQRGSGKSTPYGELTDNTTWDLVADIEEMRRHLGIDRWLVFGGSWGSTLALAYAVRHPQIVQGLVLRGIFLCRSSEIHWFYQEGASHIFPDAWQDYLKPIPPEERGDLVGAYYRRLTRPNSPEEQLEAALAWCVWEATTAALIPNPQKIAEAANPEHVLSFAPIECHYMQYRAFMPSDDYLIAEITDKLQNIPCRIVQGRYDLVCPIQTAWELSRALPHAELQVVPDAGHSSFDPGMTTRLIQATEDFKKYCS